MQKDIAKLLNTEISDNPEFQYRIEFIENETSYEYYEVTINCNSKQSVLQVKTGVSNPEVFIKIADEYRQVQWYETSVKWFWIAYYENLVTIKFCNRTFQLANKEYKCHNGLLFDGEVSVLDENGNPINCPICKANK